MELKAYTLLRKAYLEANPLCRVCMDLCFRAPPATEIHHLEKRHGKRLNDFSKVIGVCDDHHHAIHQNPSWAREHGYLI